MQALDHASEDRRIDTTWVRGGSSDAKSATRSAFATFRTRTVSDGTLRGTANSTR